MELFFFTRGGCASCLRACLGARLLPQSYQYPNLSEGTDSVGGQLRENKVCPFSGVTSSGRVGRMVPESDAGSLEDGAGKRRWEFGGRCRKATLGVWRTVPESHAGGLEDGAGERRWEFGGRCRKAMLGVWRTVLGSDAGSVDVPLRGASRSVSLPELSSGARAS